MGHNPTEVQEERVRKSKPTSMILVAMLMLAWVALPSEATQIQASSLSPGNVTFGDSRGSPVILTPLTQAGTGTAVFPLTTTSNTWRVNSQTSTTYVLGETLPPTLMNLFPLTKSNVFMQRRRNKLEIYSEILRRLHADPLGITEIALFCRLNFSSAKEMVDYLVSLGLLEALVIEDNLRYATTSKGSESLRDLERVSALLQPTVDVL